MDEEEIIDNPLNDDENIGDEEGIIYRTYRMDFRNKRIIGMVDGLEAAGQGMFKALQTRRYAHDIYDEQYGSDILEKLSNSDLTLSYLESDIPAMIEDTFANMEEIVEIDDIQFEIMDGDAVHIVFTAITAFGDTIVEGGINDG